MKEGDRVPDFSLPDQEGRIFLSSALLGKRALVLFFYPKDHTHGCTRQACAFRDQYTDFMEHGAEVVGISSDPESSHKQFARQHALPFRLLADRGGRIRKLFGVQGPLWNLLPGRETFVIDPSGILRFRFNSMSPGEHTHRALEALKSIKQP